MTAKAANLQQALLHSPRLPHAAVFVRQALYWATVACLMTMQLFVATARLAMNNVPAATPRGPTEILPTHLAANGIADSIHGMFKSLVICSVMIAGFLAVLSVGFCIRGRPVPAVWAGGVAVGCACLVSLPALELLTPHKNSYPVPVDAPMPPLAQHCHCVVFQGRLILVPVFYDLIAIVANFGVSYAICLAKATLTPSEETDGKSMGELLYHSAAHPSLMFIAPNIALHILHFLSLIHNAWGMTFWGGYTFVYMNWINSGLTAFMVAAFYGTLLFQSEDRNTLGFWVRFLSGVILSVFLIPPVLTHVTVSILLWPWATVTFEGLLMLMVSIFFPQAMENVLSIFLDREVMGVLVVPLMLVFFPLAKPIAFLANKLDVSDIDTLGRTGGAPLRLTDLVLSPGLHCIAVSILCLMKVMSLQLFFNSAQFLYMGVSYFEAVPLNFEARHVLCNSCMMEGRVEAISHSSARLVAEVYWQLASIF